MYKWLAREPQLKSDYKQNFIQKLFKLEGVNMTFHAENMIPIVQPKSPVSLSRTQSMIVAMADELTGEGLLITTDKSALTRYVNQLNNKMFDPIHPDISNQITDYMPNYNAPKIPVSFEVIDLHEMLRRFDPGFDTFIEYIKQLEAAQSETQEDPSHND